MKITYKIKKNRLNENFNQATKKEVVGAFPQNADINDFFVIVRNLLSEKAKERFRNEW